MDVGTNESVEIAVPGVDGVIDGVTNEITDLVDAHAGRSSNTRRHITEPIRK